MAIKPREAKGSLLQKGFKEEKKRDHQYFFFYFQGRKTNAYTYFSHGSESQDIDDSLLKRMAKELKLDRSQQARDLLSCPLDQEGYVTILIGKNIIARTQA